MAFANLSWSRVYRAPLTSQSGRMLLIAQRVTAWSDAEKVTLSFEIDAGPGKSYVHVEIPIEDLPALREVLDDVDGGPL